MVVKNSKTSKRTVINRDDQDEESNSNNNRTARQKRTRDTKVTSTNSRGTKKARVSEDVDDVAFDDSENILRDLLERTCKINFVSPLRIPEIDSNILRRFSKQILVILDENLSVHQNKRWIYQVNFKTVVGIKEDDRDSESLYFEIHRKKVENDESSDEDQDDDVNLNRKYSRVFHGLFTARGSNGKTMKHYKTRGSSYQNLPVLIYQGLPAIWKCIEETLKSILSCHIIPFTFTTTAMKAITGRWILIAQVSDTINLKDVIQLSVTFPLQNGPPVKQEIQLYLKHLEDILMPWTEMRHVNSKNVSIFWEELYTRFQRASQMNLDKFTVQKIVLKNFQISESGSFKAKKPNRTILKDLVSSLTKTVENNNNPSLRSIQVA